MASSDPKPSSTLCANCDAVASTRCKGCIDAPEYESGETTTGTIYCNRECQVAHWPTHKARCNLLQRRKKLLRVATILRSTLLTYRECMFDLDIGRMEFRQGVLYLLQRPKQNTSRTRFARFPIHLTDNVEYKEAALANNQCTLAMALLGPLARHLLAGVSLSILISDIYVGKPVFSTRLVSSLTAPSHPPNLSTPHTVLVVELRSNNKKTNNEKWIVDAAGCQYGFRDALSPMDRYYQEKKCEVKTSNPYDATETKDIDYFLTLPFMTATAQDRKMLMKDRDGRLHFAAFVKTRIREAEGGFNRGMLTGTMPDFQVKLDDFISDLKEHMTEFVGQCSGMEKGVKVSIT